MSLSIRLIKLNHQRTMPHSIGTYAIDVWENISSGGRLNKKDGLTRYGNSHVKAVLSLTWKSPYVDKTVFILRRGPGHCIVDLPQKSGNPPRSFLFYNIVIMKRYENIDETKSHKTPIATMVFPIISWKCVYRRGYQDIKCLRRTLNSSVSYDLDNRVSYYMNCLWNWIPWPVAR